MKNVLITGGAGFIGTNLCSSLVKAGYSVFVLDNFAFKTDNNTLKCRNLILKNKKIKTTYCDINNEKLLNNLIKNQNIIYHLVSETGTSISMDKIQKYSKTNILGTTTLLNSLLKYGNNLEKIILSSSRAVYGEGVGYCTCCNKETLIERNYLDFSYENNFQNRCSICKNYKIIFKGNNENDILNPKSFYALTKKIQEDIFKYFYETTNIPTIIFRYQNVYGPLQALNNPYSGIISIFIKNLLNNKNIEIYENNEIYRDFIFIDDVTNINLYYANNNVKNLNILNVGTGIKNNLNHVAELMLKYTKTKSKIIITNKFRQGDVKECFANINKLNQIFITNKFISLENGIEKTIDFIKNNEYYK